MLLISQEEGKAAAGSWPLALLLISHEGRKAAAGSRKVAADPGPGDLPGRRILPALLPDPGRLLLILALVISQEEGSFRPCCRILEGCC